VDAGDDPEAHEDALGGIAVMLILMGRAVVTGIGVMAVCCVVRGNGSGSVVDPNGVEMFAVVGMVMDQDAGTTERAERKQEQGRKEQNREPSRCPSERYACAA